MKTLSHKRLSKLLTLGKDSSYCKYYEPSLLQGIPRYLNRNILGIMQKKNMPFHGEDIWTLYDLSWLNIIGVPQVAIGQVVLDANSTNLVESKSFKMYLNSFNQTKFSSWKEVSDILVKDLSFCVNGIVNVNIYSINNWINRQLIDLDGECIDDQDIDIDYYECNNLLLDGSCYNYVVEETLMSNLFKSNCLITNQPDWGSIQITYRGFCINRKSLLRYLISFREHNDFNEHCVERIFCDLMRFCSPEKLSVYIRYNRRGGLDINPWRSNTKFSPNEGRLVRQ